MRVYTCGLRTKNGKGDGVFFIHHDIQLCLNSLYNPDDGSNISEYYIKVQEMEPLTYIRINQDNLTNGEILDLCELYELGSFERY